MNNKLTLSRNRQICGVCAGIAEFLGWDASKIRLICFIGLFISAGTLIIAYLICAFVFPKPPEKFDLEKFRR